jgi:hypothetical protein
MSVASLQLQGQTCPHDCNNNGWCNNLGHCHCRDGYAPPFCEDPGPGGSEDSGPASDPEGTSFDSRKWHLKVFVSARKEFVIALFVIFLGIIPGMVLLALLSYYMKHNLLYFRSAKPSAPTYVKDCLFSSFQHVLSACRGGSLFSSRSASGGSNTPNNIRNLEIKQTGLVSTTNADVIIRSNTITKNTNRESGGRRLSLKNIKGLKLNTSLRAKKDCGSSQNSETPATTETVCFESPMVVVSVRDLARRFDQTPQKM